MLARYNTLEAVCSECGSSCLCKALDFGIGGYEYWGSRGTDIQLEAVSDCCEAPCFKPETGKEITLTDLELEGDF